VKNSTSSLRTYGKRLNPNRNEVTSEGKCENNIKRREKGWRRGEKVESSP